jgi:hypothetical protein
MEKRSSEDEAEKVEESSLGRLLDGVLPESLKRALFMGAGMLFLTEESIRKGMSEFNIPREAVNYLIRQSEKSKRELFQIFQRELNRFLSAIDPTRLTKEVLDGISLEINTKITFRTGKEDGALIPKIENVKARPHVKSERK